MVKKLTRTYRGINIYYNPQPAHWPFRWTTVTGGLAADTLAGIKQLIREYQGGKS